MSTTRAITTWFLVSHNLLPRPHLSPPPLISVHLLHLAKKPVKHATKRRLPVNTTREPEHTAPLRNTLLRQPHRCYKCHPDDNQNQDPGNTSLLKFASLPSKLFYKKFEAVLLTCHDSVGRSFSCPRPVLIMMTTRHTVSVYRS